MIAGKIFLSDADILGGHFDQFIHFHIFDGLFQ